MILTFGHFQDVTKATFFEAALRSNSLKQKPKKKSVCSVSLRKEVSPHRSNPTNQNSQKARQKPLNEFKGGIRTMSITSLQKKYIHKNLNQITLKALNKFIKIINTPSKKKEKKKKNKKTKKGGENVSLPSHLY